MLHLWSSTSTLLHPQVRRLRVFPSVLAFWYSSDELPPVRVEEEYLAVLREEHWPNPVLASASNLTSTITGPTGVKVRGNCRRRLVVPVATNLMRLVRMPVQTDVRAIWYVG